MTGWRDLGDDELAARLEQRGLDVGTVGLLVAAREDPDVWATIGEVLADG